MFTLQDILKEAEQRLSLNNITDAKLDAWYLAMECFHITRMDYFMNQNRVVSSEEYQRYQDMIEARIGHVPYQYIIGKQEFMGFEFIVDESVLIPRQDTEILVEEVLKVAEGSDILDMCTGSGCIIISIGKLGNTKSLTAVDISLESLKVAQANASKLDTNVNFIHSDMFENVSGTYDIIVSNPPYIPTTDIKELMPEVKENEPVLALDGLEDGLHFYRILAKEAKNYLKDNGYLYLEIGYNQGEAVRYLLEAEGFRDVIVKKDLAGLDRVVIGRKA
jgi:release factor glutamine methyltransferase